MARAAARLPENVPGDLFVDSTCIDCDLCRQLAPETFAQSARSLSFVARQPATPEQQQQRAMIALVTCPTASIGTVSHASAAPAVAALPERIESEVYFCGFASADSYGASSYLIRRTDGNVLVDSPRAAEPLMRRIAELGGVRWLFLTHADDVADHRRWARALRLHARDARGPTSAAARTTWSSRSGGTDPTALAPDLVAVPVPGHTAGSTALLYRDTFLFTGDHLWWSPNYQRLHASRGVCWHSWPGAATLAREAARAALRVGAPRPRPRGTHAPSAEAMRLDLEQALAALFATA